MTNQETILNVIQQDPLYKKRKVYARILQDTIGRLGRINYKCSGKCESIQTFALTNVNNNKPTAYQQDFRALGNIAPGIGNTFQIIYVENNSFYHLEFTCLMCNQYTINFLLLFEYVDAKKGQKNDTKGTTVIQKIGQYPSQEDVIDKDVEKWLSKTDKDLYQKGLRSELNGFGIGAYGYFRRIVENNIEKLLDQIAGTTDDNDLIEAIAMAKSKHNAEDRLKIVKDHAPGSFSYKQQNVFRILYSALSEGLHQDTDEDCLESATSVRICLDFLIKRVHRSKEEQKTLELSIKRLSS